MSETKSTVLVKHCLKQLKLPTMHAECEKIAARGAKENLDNAAGAQPLVARVTPEETPRLTKVWADSK